MTLARKYQVIVVGAGPVGLGLALDLGLRGVDCLLVEQTDGTIEHSKMNEVNTRTMEFTRRWGIDQEVMNCPFPDDYPGDVSYVTSMTGREIIRYARPARAVRKPDATSPMMEQTCSQVWFDPMLAARAKSFPSVTVAYRHRLKGFTDDATVTADIEDLDGGETVQVEADYLVGCDGSRSIVRDAIGIELEGQRRLGYSHAAFFIAPRLLEDCGKDPATFYIFVDKNGIWGNFRAIDPRYDRWRLSLRTVERMELTEEKLSSIVTRGFGREYPVEFVQSDIWALNALVASSYQKGHVFLAGDSVHQLSQSGALGMNTGLGDAWDLSWKLWGTLAGWGGPKLLESYTPERRYVGRRNVDLSTQLHHIARGLETSDHLDEEGPRGDRERREMAESIERHLSHSWRRTGMELGYRYDDSAIVVPDGSEPTPDDPQYYVPTARPGSRAPHAWLKDGRSTLDLFGEGFVLLQFDPAASTEAFEQAAAGCGLPLDVHRLDEPEIAALYEQPLVLVRPDGHVAWRGSAPADAGAVVDRVRGAG